MKDENRENRPKLRYFRYAFVSFTALLVLSLGFALIPPDPPAPANPPFSEQARVAALEDSLDLRAAAERLAATAAAGAAPDEAPRAAAADRTVTLLTLQARALLSPSDSSPAQDAASASPPASVPTAPAAAAPTATAPTPAELASALSASGMRRLTDAAMADGGMARLLAGAGTAQLLAAENVAAAGGIAPGTLPHAGAGTSAGAAEPDAPAPDASAPLAGPGASACPSPLPVPSGRPAPTAAPSAEQETTAKATVAAAGGALSAAVAAEQQSVYAYQAALPRLAAKDAGAAGTFLAEHQELAAEAAARSRAACSPVEAQQPGYVLEPGFLTAPAAGLARLELGSLPVFGDVVAHADGGLRAWAIDALQSAARRTAYWGGDPGPVPGVLLDQDRLPDLPANSVPAATGS